MSEIPQSDNRQKVAFGYLRYSDKKQAKGETLKNQRQAIEQYAKTNKITVKRWFEDKAKSGKNTDRDGLQDLLKAALKMKKGTLDYVIVYKMNRASRDLDSYVTSMRSVLSSRGIQVRSATEQFDDSPIGRFIENIHVMIGQLDNENKRETVKDNMALLAKQGYWLSRPLRGYKKAKILNSDGQERPTMKKGSESKIVTQILMRWNRGDITVAELCRYATSIGFLSLKGKEISQETMTKMIKYVGYAGFIQSKLTGGELIKGKHPGLIDEEVYWQNQEILKRKNKVHLLGQKHYTIHSMTPLSLYIRCVKCNKHMTRSNPGGKYRYYCARPSCRGTGSVLAEEIHPLFEDLLVRIEPKPSTLKLMKEILVRTSAKELGNINQELSELHTKVDALSDERLLAVRKNLRGGMDDDEKDEVVNAIDLEKLEINQQISELEQQQQISEANIAYALNFMANIAKQWSDATLDLKQKFLNLIFPDGFIYDIKSQNFIIDKISPLYSLISLEKEANFAKNSVLVIPRGIEPLFPG